MAGILSPNPTPARKQRVTLLSPVSTFFLGSNNDNLERAQARAARAASIRRKPVTLTADANPSGHILSQYQIMELFQNCIKLSSENKINQKNTWELNLIDHIFDIIKVEVVNDSETNFQKASCTLEAGVKIYSARVDSVHSEAYKVLGGINRAGLYLEQDSMDNGIADTVQRKESTKKEQERKLSPLSTLESSFDTLNVKRFDVAFSVDPLYHQTSAQFDEGGAKGLLLNNLGVYGGCRVLFDSLEVPGKCMSCSLLSDDKAQTIDVSHAKDCIEQMVINISKNNEISPSLKDIMNMFDDNNRPPDTFSFSQNSVEPDNEAYDDHVDDQHNTATWDFINDNNNTGPTDEGTYDREEVPFMPNYYEEDHHYVSHDLDVDNRLSRGDDFLFLKLGLTARQNTWAGPEHWKYQRAKGPNVLAKENGSSLLSKKPTNKKQAELDLEFVKALENDMEDSFAPHKNPKSLLLPPSNREPRDTMLPEDCHYQPEDLVKLFLVPNVMCFGKRARRHSDELQHQEVNGSCPSWDDECGVGDHFDDENTYNDVEDPSTLVSQPRQVEKIEVQYAKKSKQVDVHVLKETLWSSMQEMRKSAQEEALSFKNILVSFPDNNKIPAAASIDDISTHLCFICILHLANEHGLSIHGTENLDDLSIRFP